MAPTPSQTAGSIAVLPSSTSSVVVGGGQLLAPGVIAAIVIGTLGAVAVLMLVLLYFFWKGESRSSKKDMARNLKANNDSGATLCGDESTVIGEAKIVAVDMKKGAKLEERGHGPIV